MGLFHRRFEAVSAFAFDGQQRHSGQSETAGFDRFCRDHTGEGRLNIGVTARHLGGTHFLIYLRQLRVQLDAPRLGHPVGRLRRFEPSRRLIEFLIGNRLLLKQVLHAAKRRLRQIEIGFRCRDGAVGLGHGRSNFLAGGFGAPRTDVQIACIERHQRLAFADMIAGLHLHLAHIAH